MSRIAKLPVLTWDAPEGETDISGYLVYQREASMPAATFLAAIDRGELEPLGATAETRFELEGLPSGTHQFAVASRDAAGNISDPYQAEAWLSVPFDRTPPNPPTNGGFE